MRSFTPALLVCLCIGIVSCQFNNGPGNFFSFSSGSAGPAGQAAPAFRPQQQQQQQQFRQPAPAPQQQQFRQPAQAAPAAGGAGGCTPSPNYQSGNRNFWVSWRGCGSKYRADQIGGVCAAGGMKPVSLDDPALANELMGLCAREGQKYFWTGGRVSSAGVTWPNGASQSVAQLSNLFSHTGGRGVPQPDNREGDEFCLAVLNNFYNDGVKFHDVSCHHLKPTICEA